MSPRNNAASGRVTVFDRKHECAFQQALDAVNCGAYFVDRERRITYWNETCQRITGFGVQDVLGRSCSDNILCHVDDAGAELCKDDRCPLRACIADGNPRVAEVFLHHKLGYRVPVSVRGAPVRDRSGKIIGAIELFYCNRRQRSVERRLSRLKKLAYVDPLTRVANRRYLDKALADSTKNARAKGMSFGVLLIDIDKFKRVNDAFGHIAGDGVLLSTAQTIEHAFRGSDLMGRWGGEEFLVLLPNVSLSVLKKLAERCRVLVRQSWTHSGGERISVTISIGGTLFRKRESVARLIQRADRLLYASKQAGRNRATVE